MRLIERRVVLKDHAAVGAGSADGFAIDQDGSRVVGGCWGLRPAMRRSTVDLPQPEGPRMATNSPRPGRSWTVKLTSLIAVNARGVPALNVLVTSSNSTTIPFVVVHWCYSSSF